MTAARPVYDVKQKVYGLLNGTFHAATVVEVSRDATSGEFLYYVHYAEHDNRMERWLSASELKERQHGRASGYSHTYTSAGGVNTRRQSATVRPARTPTSHNSKGGGSHHTVKVSKMRARKDSSFFSRTKNIHSVRMGAYEVETWYFSPYHIARPEVQQLLQRASTYYAGSTELQLGSGNNTESTAVAQPFVRYATKSLTLHLCPFCLEPFADNGAVLRHLRFVCQRHPPGAEIYRDPVRQLIVLELDGKIETNFCQNLALLSKLFLEHKALDHDMTPFLFYVLCSIQPHGLEVLGYFSKEKQTPEMYNLSCILVLPQFQSRGVGRFLIELSYELSRREGRLGTPEKPLSDLGEKLYGSYWTESVTMAIARGMEEGHCITVDYIVQATAITPADVGRTLQTLNITKDSRINIADETVQSCFLKRMRRESDARNYTFFTHLLCWAPGMYEEVRGNPPPPTYTCGKAEEEDRSSS